jgi:dihydroorotate dehydrogenase electron transfer subunit
MLEGIHKNILKPGYLSFEARMGCGFGACMGCSCKTLTGNKRICVEGPILKSSEVIFGER